MLTFDTRIDMSDQTTPFSDDSDDVLSFADEVSVEARPAPLFWRVLIVDDDKSVHQATRLAVSGLTIQHRRLELLSAYSAAEATDILQREDDIAVILLDVVMETEDAGLQLVRKIREELKLLDLRIILHTGQPGQAPEVEVIRLYDINDYKSKAELTRTKFFSTLTSAIRSYEQIQMLHASRDGLSMVIRSSSRLLAVQGLQNFAEGVVIQITALLGIEPEGLLCLEAPESGTTAQIIAAAGHFNTLVSQPITLIPEEETRQSIESAFRQRRNTYSENGIALFIDGRSPRDLVAFIQTHRKLRRLDVQLLEVFCTNISIGFENVSLFTSLQAAAYVDTLTQLPNRLALAEKIPDMGTGMLALIDIDHFSEINDALGFEFGNALLKAVAKRLQARFGEKVLVARAGGDLFALCGSTLQLQEIPEALLDSFHILGNEIMLSVSVGNVDFSSGADGWRCLQAAGVALGQAKARRRGSVVTYIDEMGTAARERMQLLQELRQAIRSGDLSVAYQPLEKLSDGSLIGVEALLRWQRPDGSFLPPDRFIPLAESTGLIVQIGEWVLLTAIRDMRERLRRDGKKLRLSVNVSVVQFHHPGFFDCLTRALTEAGDLIELEVEVTESVAMSDPEFFSHALAHVREMGISVAIDDFGTGYSSLSYLQNLDVNRLKIDRSFVLKMADKRGWRIVDTINQMGKTLGLAVIAEGIENEADREKLLSIGCDEGQGFLFGRPMFPDQFDAWVQAREMVPASPNAMESGH